MRVKTSLLIYENDNYWNKLAVPGRTFDKTHLHLSTTPSELRICRHCKTDSIFICFIYLTVVKEHDIVGIFWWMKGLIGLIKSHISSSWIKYVKFSLGKYGLIDIFSHISDELLYAKVNF